MVVQNNGFFSSESDALLTRIMKTVEVLRTMSNQGSSPFTKQALEVVKPVEDAVNNLRASQQSARSFKDRLPIKTPETSESSDQVKLAP